MNNDLSELRSRITAAKLEDEDQALNALIAKHPISPDIRHSTGTKATGLVNDIRKTARLNTLDALLAEFGLSSPAGTALLRLAEALIRVPDKVTMDQLIADKLVGVDWKRHRGKTGSTIADAAVLGLDMTSRCLKGSRDTDFRGAMRRALKHAATPLARIAVRKATELLGGRFVHGRTIEQSIRNSAGWEKRGFTFSYDMLGEAALTQADADRFFEDYKNAIEALKPKCLSTDLRENPGISIKLSALHPRYELTQRGQGAGRVE